MDAKPKFGRAQKIAIGAMAVPFTVASVALFVDKATFSEWAVFTGVTVVTKLLGVLGFGAHVKKSKAL